MNIISSVSGPIRFLTDPQYTYKPGNVVEMTEINGNPAVTISYGRKPIGIVVEIGLPHNMVAVMCEAVLFTTDLFDMDCQYQTGDRLYVREGMVSTISTKEDEVWVGECLDSVGEDGYLEVHWI